jgi:hypothetical protein
VRNLSTVLLSFALGLALLGCTDDDGGDDPGDGSGSGSGSGSGGTGEMTVDGVPTSAGPLQAYLIGGAYRSWAGESAPHTSTGPHGRVRTFVSPGLATSLAGSAPHPKGATAIKELYSGGGDTITGWAVEIKLEDDSRGGKGWYWYEVFGNQPNSRPAAAGTGLGSCTGCHSAGHDYVRVPFPLQ